MNVAKKFCYLNCFNKSKYFGVIVIWFVNDLQLNN